MELISNTSSCVDAEISLRVGLRGVGGQEGEREGGRGGEYGVQSE